MKTKEIIKLMQGYLDGKTIQYMDYRFKDLGWKDCLKEPLWNFNSFSYRIKEEIKIIPYTIEDLDNMKPEDRVVIFGDYRHTIIKWYNNGVYIDDIPYKYSSLLKSTYHLDGRLFGKVVG